MIVRTHLILLTCWLTGHSANGLYLKYKLSPNTTELTIETLQRENTRMPREVGHWIHRNRSRKKLVILDQKNKYVAAFIQKLINLMEEERKGEKPETLTKLSNAQILSCYRTFGSLYNSKFKKCGQSSRVTVKPVLKLMTVNVIPVKTDDVFVDSTRHGSDDDSDRLFSDTDSSSDTSDSTESDNTKEEKIVQNHRRLGQPFHRTSITDWSNEVYSKDETGKKSKRFEVVNNGNGKIKKHKIQDFYNQEKQSSETDSDDEKVQQKTTTVKTYDNDDFNDSYSNEFKKRKHQSKHKKKTKKEKYTGSSSSGERGSSGGSKVKSSRNKKNVKNVKPVEKHTGDYIYLQGSRPVNSDMEESDGETKRDSDGETRRDGNNRLRDVFMPKRNVWDSSEIQHLSYYWFRGPQGHVIYS